MSAPARLTSILFERLIAWVAPVLALNLLEYLTLILMVHGSGAGFSRP